MNSLELNKEPEIVPEEKTVEQTTESIIVPAKEEPKVENVSDVVSTEEVLNELAEVKEQIQEPKQVQVMDGENEPISSEIAQKDERIMNYNELGRDELVSELKALITKEVNEVRDDVEQIKQVFYKKLKVEGEEQKKLFMEAGGEEADFKPEKDDLEETLKALLGDFKAKKAAHAARVEQEKENNLIRKQHILEQMKALTETTDDVSSHIGEFKDLQQKWKTIGMVPATMTTDLWKQYNLLQEKFWDLIKINNELREYDFKKNLEAKTVLCETAERLLDEEDIVAAMRQLQKLHEEWREVGPVAREVRDEIWNRFKDVTAQINKRHQEHFDGLRRSEEENEAMKIVLCEKLEAFDTSELKTFNAWNKATDKIKALQEEWRSIGFSSRKVNQALYERYRRACDNFFDKKATFYAESKAEFAENLEKKKALCEQAEALKDSTDWKETAEMLVKLQRQWKEIGAVPKKDSDELWKRFITACDYFFEQKNKNASSQRNDELDNLKNKQAIIEKINNLDVSDAGKAYAALKELIEEFRNIGYVPFKDKDKIYKVFRAAVDKQFDTLNIDANNRRLESFRTNLEDMSSKGEQKLYREREKLLRSYEHLKSEIATYENNIGFFSSTSKKANSMLKEMERKIENLKEESKLLEQKIRMIDEKL